MATSSATTTGPATAGRSLRFVGLLAALFTSFIAATYGFGIYLFPVLLPDMHASLGFTYEQAGVATAGGQVGFLLGALGTDMLARRWGNGLVLCLAIVLCALSLLGMFFVPNIWIAALCLTLLGATASLAYTPMVEMCQHFISARRRGTVLCLISSGTSYGVFINGLIVPFVLAHGGWREIWLILGLGVLLLAIAAVVFLYTNGLLRKADTTDDAPTGRSFSLRDRLALAAQRRVFIAWLLMFINGFACLSFQTYFSPYLRGELGFSAAFAGSLWTLVGVIGMAGGFMMGMVADRLSLRFVMGVSYALIGIASAALLTHAAPTLLYLAAVTFSLGFYAIFGLFPAYISCMVATHQSTFVFAIGNITLATGAMVGNYAGGWLRTALGTFAWTYILIILLACVSLAVLPLLPHDRGSAPTTA